MPDIPNRDELERKYGRAIGRELNRQKRELIRLMGDPPDINKIPIDFWTRNGKLTEEVLRPLSEQIYLEAAERMMTEIPVGVDWSMVNETAMNWASNYNYELVRGITDTTQRGLQTAVSDFYRQQTISGELTQNIVNEFQARTGRLFSHSRAEMIGITETTRAAVEGEREAVMMSNEILSKYGIEPMTEIWLTRNDELVCPICEPRNNKKEGDGWTKDDGPPAHPRCRCTTRYERPKKKKK